MTDPVTPELLAKAQAALDSRPTQWRGSYGATPRDPEAWRFEFHSGMLIDTKAAAGFVLAAVADDLIAAGREQMMFLHNQDTMKSLHAFSDLVAERDKLKAEVERLRASFEYTWEGDLVAANDRIARLTAALWEAVEYASGNIQASHFGRWRALLAEQEGDA